MPSQLENAIAQLQDEVDLFQQGTKVQPKDDTSEWYLLRAKSLGLTYLKQLQGQGLEGRARQCEQLYTSASKHFKNAAPAPRDFPIPEVPALLQAREAA